MFCGNEVKPASDVNPKFLPSSNFVKCSPADKSCNILQTGGYDRYAFPKISLNSSLDALMNCLPDHLFGKYHRLGCI